jgi:hypothetical protein
MDDVVAYFVRRPTCIRELQGRDADAAIGLLRALDDTLVGIVTWAPLRYPLVLHLKSVIPSRLSLRAMCMISPAWGSRAERFPEPMAPSSKTDLYSQQAQQ